MFKFLSAQLTKWLLTQLDNSDRQAQLSYAIITISAILALITLLLCTGFYSQQQTKIAQYTVDGYGESLASLAADRIAVTTFDQDPISLQAVVRAIANKKAVVSVVTYDVNNTILAQAEKQQSSATTISRLQYYTAPVTISNSLAGSITLGIDPILFNGSINYTTIWIAAILLIVIAIMAYRQRQLSQRNAPSSQEVSSAVNNKQTNDEIDEQLVDSKIDSSMVTLNVQLLNIDTLQQQLNAESRQRQLQQLQLDIDHSTALYGASIVSITNNSIVLNFGHANKDNVFNALCCGQLLLRLNQEKPKAILTIANTVMCIPEHHRLEKTLAKVRANYHPTHYAKKLLITDDLVDTYALEKRISCASINAEETQHTEESPEDILFEVVESFQQSYSTLINNQLLQLQKQQT